MRKTIIGVMGPADAATDQDLKNAFELGRLIALNGWVLLSGGGHSGVMDAVNQGAKTENGLTVGIIWTDVHTEVSSAVDIPIVTGLGSARNNINVLSSDVVIACGMAAGTASEVSLALKAKRHVILLNDNQLSKAFFADLGKEYVHVVAVAEEAIAEAKKILKTPSAKEVEINKIGHS
jgi:uncharacterized protein (TIGR00725 family)